MRCARLGKTDLQVEGTLTATAEVELSESDYREIDEILSSALRIAGPSPEGK